jgi:hypothetical protein
MKNKINIAELLKNCPSGMELDCVMYDNLYFDKVVEDFRYPIGCYTIYDGCRTSVNFTEFGEFNNYGTAKCVIFPKDRTTWEGFHRPFKDGDIISDGFFDTICIFKGEGRIKGTVDFYCGISGTDELFIKDVKDQDEHFGEINEYKFATEEEKEKLFQVIKDNGYRWNAETKILEKLITPNFKKGDKVRVKNGVSEPRIIEDVCDTFYTLVPIGKIDFTDQDKWELVPNKFDITTFKPFDKVLVRCSSLEKWRIQFFEKYDKTYQSPFICLGSTKYKQCIPYNDNEHLLDKTDECDEFYKIW